eukprot:7360216-Alexandrium_andersonii.AAC.1
MPHLPVCGPRHPPELPRDPFFRTVFGQCRAAMQMHQTMSAMDTASSTVPCQGPARRARRREHHLP